MPKLGNYITGRWIEGDGEGQPLYNAFTGELIGHASTKGLDFAAILDYARTTGNPVVAPDDFSRKRPHAAGPGPPPPRTFREILPRSATWTGATRADSWIDLEGGIGNLFSYASLRRKFPE
jgi:oxepin-CoA hydrolase/3-oxo-5,6-dehydrosuberyl-CoA semialdehyde dehydrogenase